MQSFETLGKLADVKGNVWSSFDKLKRIKVDLVRDNEDWQGRNFNDLFRELRYQQLMNENLHLKGLVMEDVDKKERLPVHIILGASECAKLKKDTAPRIGKPEEPVVELTRFGWTIMSPGNESVNLTNMLLIQTS